MKRGGGQTPLSLDTDIAEQRYRVEPGEGVPADKVFERRWALTLLERTMARLREEFAAAGKPEEFERLKVFLTAERGAIAYAEIAGALGVSEGAAREIGRASCRERVRNGA